MMGILNARIAKEGLIIYFIGFFFAGINIIMTMYLSSSEHARRLCYFYGTGCVLIVPMVFLLSSIWEMTGIWLAFVATECIVTMISLWTVAKLRKTADNHEKVFTSIPEESY